MVARTSRPRAIVATTTGLGSDTTPRQVCRLARIQALRPSVSGCVYQDRQRRREGRRQGERNGRVKTDMIIMRPSLFWRVRKVGRSTIYYSSYRGHKRLLFSCIDGIGPCDGNDDAGKDHDGLCVGAKIGEDGTVYKADRAKSIANSLR